MIIVGILIVLRPVKISGLNIIMTVQVVGQELVLMLILVILVEGDPMLFNPYGVIAINPDKGPHIKHGLANTFIDWLISLPAQERISQFGVTEFGSALFTPDSQLWRAAQGGGA